MSEETPEEVARTYESATARLEEIIRRLDSGDAQLRETLELCEEAKGLIEYCAGELAAVDQGLKELKLEDLAGSLTGSTPDAAPPAPAPGQSEQALPTNESDVPF
ncbi:MAG: exodeoxyribonuclease small subunit [Actinomycetota bacterium]|jgi:exodeoxyribonuclease VII small subunit|nr:exodeoxyribonuclease small subunit [Actinomycetota bacterium]